MDGGKIPSFHMTRAEADALEHWEVEGLMKRLHFLREQLNRKSSPGTGGIENEGIQDDLPDEDADLEHDLSDTEDT